MFQQEVMKSRGDITVQKRNESQGEVWHPADLRGMIMQLLVFSQSP